MIWNECTNIYYSSSVVRTQNASVSAVCERKKFCMVGVVAVVSMPDLNL